MPDLAELNLKVDSTSVTRAQRALDGFSSASSRSAQAARKFQAASLAMAAGITAFGASAVAQFAKFEQTSLGLETLIGNAEQARDIIGELKDFSSTTPFQFQDLAGNVKLLKALGFETTKLIPTMKDLAEAASAVGGANAGQVLDRLGLALGQIIAKGTVQAQEMRQLAEAGIPAWEFLAEAVGKTQGEVRKLVSQGKVESQAAVDVILSGIRNRFGGLTQALSQTTAGLFSTLRDNIVFTMIDIGGAIDEAFDVKGILRGLIDFTRVAGVTLGNAVKIIGGIADEAALADTSAIRLADTMKVLGGAAAALVAIKMGVWLGAVAGGLKALTLAMASNPFLLLATAASVAVGWIAANWNEMVTFGDTTARVSDFVVGAWDHIAERVSLVGRFIEKTWRSFGPMVQDAMRSSLRHVESFATGVLTAVGGLGRAMFRSFTGIANSVIAVFDTMFQAIERQFQRFSAIRDAVRDVGRAGTLEEAALGAGRALAALSESSNLRANLGAIAGDLGANLERDYIETAVTGLRLGAKAGASAIEDELKDVFRALAADPEYATIFEEWGKIGGLSLGTAFDDIAKRASERLQNSQRLIAPVPTDAVRAAIGPLGQSPDLLIPGTDALSRFDEYLGDLRHEKDLLGLTNEARQRAMRLREGEAIILKQFGAGTLEAAAAMTSLTSAVDALGARELEIVRSDAAKVYQEYLRDLQSEADLLGLTGAGRERAIRLREAERMVIEAFGPSTDAGRRALAGFAEEYDKLVSAQRTASFLNRLETGVRDSLVDGIEAALNDGDWQEVLRSTLMQIGRDGFGEALKSLSDSAAGTDSQGNQQSLFGSLGQLLGLGGGGGGTGTGFGGAGQGAPLPTATGPAIPKTQYLINVIDEGTATATVSKIDPKAAEVLVMRGTGNPGVSAGTIHTKRRR